MYVKTLVYDQPEGADVEVSLSAEDALATVEERIRQLDGAERTLMIIYSDGGHLAVGGGGPSGFLVYATYDNETFPKLINPDAAEGETVETVVGGQPSRRERRELVTEDLAIRAAKVFATSGDLADDLTWVAS